MEPYIKLGIAAFLPVVVSAFLYFINRKTPFGKIDKRIRYVIWGIIFGALAVVGTEWGIQIDGAAVNCRDAAVLTAGLFFGAPAGIIAGVIGGVERWIAVAWGVGSFTRLACSLSTILAGIYAALLRKYMFEDKKPGWFIAAAVGIVMEVVHLTMVFLTNMSEPYEAMRIIEVCAVPMILANGLSVMLSGMVLAFLSDRNNIARFGVKKQVRISQTIQKWLLVAIVAAFLATSFFVFGLQNQMANSQGDKLLTMALDEVEADIKDMSDANLMGVALQLAGRISKGYENLDSIAEEYDVAEINIIDGDGFIIDSTDERFLGYDMRSGEQSAEFLKRLSKTGMYVQDYGPISYDSSLSRKYAGIDFGSGFIQVGYDAVQFQKDIDQDIVGITANRHVGETGFILIIDEQFNVISAPDSLDLPTIKQDADGVDLPEPDVTFQGSLNGVKCWVRYRSAEGYHIVSILPEDEILHTRNIALYVNSFMEIIVFAVLFGLIYILIKRVVVNQIKNINASLGRITAGNLSEVVNVRSNEEFASLSDDINMTVDTLKHYIDEASKRIDQELEFAQRIQRSALPSVFPAFPKRKDMDIFASMDPAKEVGGDFYDFYMTKNDTLNFLVADVSGKGIPAAMFMMRAKTELKTLTEADMSLADVFTTGNSKLCEGNDANMFVTVWQGSLDLTTGHVKYASAGHNPPVVRHADGYFEFLPSKPGFVMAGMEGMKYKTQEADLAPGDILYLYTDGVTEATNSEEKLYGNERLLKVLNNAEFTNMEELCVAVKKSIDEFVGDAPQFDDITMVALRYVGNPPLPSVHFDEAKIADITEATEFVERQLEEVDISPKAQMQINVCIDEIFSNIVNYGYPKGPGPVTVEFIRDDEKRSVSLRFTDEGIPYNPLVKDDPDVTLSAEERQIGGLGIYMVKKVMDDMRYYYEDGKNILVITKNLD